MDWQAVFELEEVETERREQLAALPARLGYADAEALCIALMDAAHWSRRREIAALTKSASPRGRSKGKASLRGSPRAKSPQKRGDPAKRASTVGEKSKSTARRKPPTTPRGGTGHSQLSPTTRRWVERQLRAGRATTDIARELGVSGYTIFYVKEQIGLVKHRKKARKRKKAAKAKGSKAPAKKNVAGRSRTRRSKKTTAKGSTSKKRSRATKLR